MTPHTVPTSSSAVAVHAAQSLSDLPIGVPAHVVGLRPAADDAESRELALRLLEIGFMAGEPVRVIAQGHPGREPIAVRIGGTTFALRRFEAEQVLVERERA
ncbi:MAG: FeoA family protein [Burkholderiales bacterium]